MKTHIPQILASVIMLEEVDIGKEIQIVNGVKQKLSITGIFMLSHRR